MIKLATPEEMNFYKKVLYPIQDRILDAVGRAFGDAFYLTGGTALSRFYFHHSLSEDIDLFTGTENIKTAAPRLVRILEGLGYRVEVKSVSITFGRLFVSLKDREEMLKIDLVADYPLEKPKAIGKFYVDTINNIAVNKITAFEDRAEFKDLVDLYYIVEKEKIDLNKILELADKKRVPVPYENLLTINTIGLTGSVSLLKEIKDERLKNFLKYLKETLEVNVKKKFKRPKRG